MSLDSPWDPNYPDPHQAYMPRGATIVGGAMVPHDLELAKYFGYTPVMQGWMSGRLSRNGLSGLSGFGATSEEEYQTRNEAEHQMMLQRIAEEMKTLRWQRIWSGVSALAAVAAVAISIAAYRRR